MVDAVGRRDHEHRRLLLRHPGEHAGQDPLTGAAVAATVAAEAFVDLVNPEHAGGHRLGPLNRFPGAGFTGTHQAGEKAPHIEPQQRHRPTAGDCFRRERFTRALRAHQQYTAGHRQAESARLIGEGPMPLLQPVLQNIESTDRLRARGRRAELQHFTAGDRLTLLLQHFLQIGGAQLPPACQSSSRHLAHPQFAQAAAGAGELFQNAWLKGLSAALADAAQQATQVFAVGKRQIQKGERFIQIGRGHPGSTAHEQGVRGAAQRLLQVAQHACDAGIFAKAVKVLQQQQGGAGTVEVAQPLQNRHRLTAARSFRIQDSLEAINEIPAPQLTLQT